ncbi:MAG: 50S ribosomal protein L15 [Myxococcaceae bacterium]
MVTLHTLKKPYNSTHRKKRVGRGQGSGLGKTAGRGGKGQKARTGNMRFEGFEGGQSPLQRRLPKFGFNSPNRVELAIVNLDELEAHFKSGATVDEKALRAAGLVKGVWDGTKVLGGGKLSHKLVIKVNKVSEGAKAAITAAGGSVEEIPLMVHKPEAAAKAHSGKGVAKA